MHNADVCYTIGMDIAKNIFQLHIRDESTGRIEKVKLKRHRVSAFFSNRTPSLVAIEACGGAHHWGRLLSSLGHTVKLLPPNQVKPFVLRDKTDARDAQAIHVAAQQPHIKPVPIKSPEQQVCLSLHRMRAQLMKMRIMQTNALRGFLYEFGIAMPEGHQVLLSKLKALLETELPELPKLFVESLREQFQRVNRLQADIESIDRRLTLMGRQNHQMRAIQEIPGIGPLSATAIVSTTGHFAEFKSGRQFAAWLGLTPKQRGTGGKIRQMGISKRDDPYVRTVLIHGARAIIARSKRTPWMESLLARKPYSVTVVALANKLARVVWAVLAKVKPSDRDCGYRKQLLPYDHINSS